MIYEEAFDPDENLRQTIPATLRENGWSGVWTNGIFSYHHYHGNAHEFLGVVQGSARVTFGGEAGEIIDLETGDAAVLPAGTGHRRLTSESLVVVGAYPEDQTDYDLNRAHEPVPDSLLKQIKSVPTPTMDPVQGPDGPLIKHWRN